MPLMVFGRVQRAVDDGRIWDYAAVPYPHGNSDREHTYLFDRGQIRELLFVGFQTDAEERLRGRIARLEKGGRAGFRPSGGPEGKGGR